MHEVSLVEGVIQIIEQAAIKQQFSQVRVCWLEVGSLAGVETEALRFCFDAVARGTVAQGARLEIIDVPGLGTCLDCAGTHPVRAQFDPCPACGSDAVQVSGGNALRVKELDVI